MIFCVPCLSNGFTDVDGATTVAMPLCQVWWEVRLKLASAELELPLGGVQKAQPIALTSACTGSCARGHVLKVQGAG